MDSLVYSIIWHFQSWIVAPMRKYWQPYIIKKIRRKKKIKILFILVDLGQWKTEELYKKMLEHPRFHPIIGVVSSQENISSKQNLIDYLRRENYDYEDLDIRKFGIYKIFPDIIFYQKPYQTCFPNNVHYELYQNFLSCYCPYGVHTFEEKWNLSLNIKVSSWQNYYENLITYESVKSKFPEYSKNIVVTGLPFFDTFLKSSTNFCDPWRSQDKKKKRIIYAPHHTIADKHQIGMALSTFLENGEFLLSLARKYADVCQFAFKPHPFLRSKLNMIWGETKTNEYFHQWEELPNCQIESGDYVDLFMSSDALIHDCNSFIIEYLYTQKPVLYLLNSNRNSIEFNEFAIKAFDLHYKAATHSEIELFITNLLSGNDPLKMGRDAFYSSCLLPPNGKTASDNIVSSILGEFE